MTDITSLSHYGVKGMKWGVRNDKGHEGERAKTKTIRKADKQYEKQFTGVKGFVKVQNAMAGEVNSRLSVLNNSPKYSVNMRAPGNEKIMASYLKEYEKIVDQAASAATASMGTNASGTQQLVISRTGTGMDTAWEARFEEINHAALGGAYIRIVPQFNSTGQIVSQTFDIVVDEGSVAHTFLIENEDSLAHYGVKGMRWGVRRAERNKRNENYSDDQMKRDKQVYGARGAKRINRNMNKGDSISTARATEKTKRDRVMGKNKYVRQGGKLAGGAAGAVLGNVALTAISAAASSNVGKQAITSIAGPMAAATVSGLANSTAVRGVVTLGAANVGYMMSGDAAVAANMRIHGYNPDRK